MTIAAILKERWLWWNNDNQNNNSNFNNNFNDSSNDNNINNNDNNDNRNYDSSNNNTVSSIRFRGEKGSKEILWLLPSRVYMNSFQYQDFDILENTSSNIRL